MRTVYCPPLDRQVSVLGFGCASLGSRISAANGLRAMRLAFDNGVTWFDVAPPYGDGQAETLLGAFLTGRRDEVAICTKVGIARPVVSRPKAMLRMLARPIVKAVPQLRGRIASLRRPGIRAPIDASNVEASVIESLRALKTDHVDVLALHEPSPAEVNDPEILGSLQRMVEKGYARAVSVAGSFPSVEAAAALSAFPVVQTTDNPFERVRSQLPDHLFAVTHSIFGSGTLERFSTLLDRDSALQARLKDASGGMMPNEMLLDYAFASNPVGVVLASMFSPRHVSENCAHAARSPNVALCEAIRAAVYGRPA